MTKPRKDTDYLFLSARIRSLEKDLLTSQRLEQLLQSPSVENCSQLLGDLGYAPIRDEASLQSSLKRQREAVFAELERFMPEKQLLDVFRITIHRNIPFQWCPVRISVIKQCCIHAQNAIRKQLRYLGSLRQSLGRFTETVITGFYPFNDFFVDQFSNGIGVIAKCFQI